jgi:23S rRNA pseudouridine1911/1915/1917 synthase
MSTRLSFVTQPRDAGRRLDVILAARLDRSRTACAALIKRGLVRVNGATAKAAHVVDAGERVEADVPAPVEPAAAPERIPIAIVYQDADLCVVDKPAGMATHPAPGSPRGTLVNALLAALGPLPSINGVLRPGIVHRLDKDTSGLLVVAKSDRAMRGLSKAIASRTVCREYDAIVWGAPPSRTGTIDAPIARDTAVRTRFAVRKDGRSAITHYRVKEKFRDCSLLRLRLDTGRTHQIRVHCAAIGHPIVGDATYGAGRPRLGAPRQMLHAVRLSFAHPVTGKAMAFESPWPDDFASLIDRLRAGSAA